MVGKHHFLKLEQQPKRIKGNFHWSLSLNGLSPLGSTNSLPKQNFTYPWETANAFGIELGLGYVPVIIFGLRADHSASGRYRWVLSLCVFWINRHSIDSGLHHCTFLTVVSYNEELQEVLWCQTEVASLGNGKFNLFGSKLSSSSRTPLMWMLQFSFIHFLNDWANKHLQVILLQQFGPVTPKQDGEEKKTWGKEGEEGVSLHLWGPASQALN